MRADSKISGFAAEFAGCVWTKAATGKKKLHMDGAFESGFHEDISKRISISIVVVRTPTTQA